MTVSKNHTDQLPQSSQREAAFAEQPPQAGGLAEDLLEQFAGGTEEMSLAYRDLIRRQESFQMEAELVPSGSTSGSFNGSYNGSIQLADSPATLPLTPLRKP